MSFLFLIEGADALALVRRTVVAVGARRSTLSKPCGGSARDGGMSSPGPAQRGRPAHDGRGNMEQTKSKRRTNENLLLDGVWNRRTRRFLDQFRCALDPTVEVQTETNEVRLVSHYDQVNGWRIRCVSISITVDLSFTGI